MVNEESVWKLTSHRVYIDSREGTNEDYSFRTNCKILFLVSLRAFCITFVYSTQLLSQLFFIIKNYEHDNLQSTLT